MNKQQKIFKAVAKARDYFGITEYPGNFFELITGKENYINEFRLLLFKQATGKTSGFIGYSNNDIPIICINYNRPIGHQNFSLAHEIGHLFLHNGMSLCDTKDTINGRNLDDIEKEAHEFACELLYPIKYVNKDAKYIRRNRLLKEANYEELADYIDAICKEFYISFSFALYRILFCLKWYNAKRKVKHIQKKIGRITDRYEPYFYKVSYGHPYYQPYIYPLEVMKNTINTLIKLEEISYETGQAIFNRNKSLGGVDWDI